MSDPSDFLIENGVLKKYTGPGGDVVVPDGVTSIGDEAFKGCTRLKSIALPEGVTSIGSKTFLNCFYLRSVALPESLCGIGEQAFSGCTFLPSVFVPERVTSIGDRAFEGCYGLKSIALPDGLTNIGDSVFENCENLTGVALPQGLTRVGDATFRWCRSLTGVALPDGLTSIGSEAFYGCSELTSIELPQGLTSIGDSAFRGCYSLTSLTLPQSVTSLGRSAFEGCTRLKNVALSDGLTSIGDAAFQDCKSLTSVTIPDGVTHISDSAFSGCQKIEIKFSDRAANRPENFIIRNGVLNRYQSFGGVVVVPDGVTSIGDRVFKACRYLTSLTLPDGLTSIGDAAFQDCKNLTSVSLPESLTSIGEQAFKGCKGLKNIELPDGLTSIGGLAFYGCSGLTSLTIPESVTSVGGWAFMDCNSLAVLVSPVKLVCGQLPCSSLALIVSGKSDRYLAYSAKCGTGDNLSDFAKRGAWARYDLELINNGPAYKFKQTAQLLGALGRLLDPVELTWENRALYAELLCKNAKKLIPLAKKLRRPRLISDLLSLGILDKETDKAVRKQLAASGLPELAALAAAAPAPAAAVPARKKTTPAPRSPLQAAYAEKLKAIGGDEIIREMKLAGLSVPVLLSDGSKAPEELFRFLLASYGDRWLHIVPEADEAAALLRYDSLCKAMEAVSGHLDGPNYPSVLPLLCRYGNARQIRALTEAYKDWGDWYRYNQRGRNAQFVLARALNLSDTREAIVWLEKHGGLSAYAALRGVTEAEICERFLFVGFDETGKRVFDLGATTVEVTLTRELGLALYDTARKKAVRSIPTKGVEPAVQKKAADELADMRQNLKKARRIKQDQLFKDYLEGTETPAERWKQSYLTNPFLRRIAQLLVWKQGKGTFLLTGTGAVDSAGAAYEITDAPIRLAHPMEMEPKDVTAWQRYFTAHGLKQPFLQIWEPVYRREDVREDRYRGCRIDPWYLKNKQKRGIDAEWIEKEYYSVKYVNIQGFSVEAQDAPYRDGDERDYLELVSIRPEIWNRRSNMIVGFLDRLTVWERVKKDDVSVMGLIPGFTLAQITEFIALAQEAGAVNVLAALLDYKNKTFPDFDPMDEFTLEW